MQQPAENQKSTKHQMSAKEGPVFTFSLSGGAARPFAPHELRHCVLVAIFLFFISFHCPQHFFCATAVPASLWTMVV